MKPVLIILSDLWGTDHADWLQGYRNQLAAVFDIRVYNSQELGQIDGNGQNQEAIHQQFVEGGIDRAVQQLMESEPNSVHMLGLSIGGAIAWKAGLKGLKIENLIAVSSTRLRYETQKPDCPLTLIYAADDPYHPEFSWFLEMNLKYTLISNAAHDLYKEERIINWVCQLLKSQA